MLPGFRLFQVLRSSSSSMAKRDCSRALSVLRFFGIDMAVDHRGVNEKRRRGEPQLVLAKISRALVFAEHVIDDSLYFAPNGHGRILPLELGREEAC